jgi:hypothetical protein
MTARQEAPPPTAGRISDLKRVRCGDIYDAMEDEEDAYGSVDAHGSGCNTPVPSAADGLLLVDIACNGWMQTEEGEHVPFDGPAVSPGPQSARGWQSLLDEPMATVHEGTSVADALPLIPSRDSVVEVSSRMKRELVWERDAASGEVSARAVMLFTDGDDADQIFASRHREATRLLEKLSAPRPGLASLEEELAGRLAAAAAHRRRDADPWRDGYYISDRLLQLLEGAAAALSRAEEAAAEARSWVAAPLAKELEDHEAAVKAEIARALASG